MSLNTGEIPALLVHFNQPNTGAMALGQSLAMAGDFARMDAGDSNLDSGFAGSFFPLARRPSHAAWFLAMVRHEATVDVAESTGDSGFGG